MNRKCGIYNFKISVARSLAKSAGELKNGYEILEQLLYFYFLDFDVSHEHDDENNKKLDRYHIMCSTIHFTLKTNQDFVSWLFVGYFVG